ncbi:hypothetical protein QFC21_001608 [Naganishia friedmannii]|uniref:Uncharacterized protein n=1 Tax=Naganishia friedmannii TaxID=89922 RepID=A0ACC2W1I3_9TREE|nr:hypothetical protein QFC21_001608 [Naganishia friedmannii]
MSVNRYNPYFNAAGGASHPGAFQGQNTIPTSSTSARNIEQAVWQWVPDGPDFQGPYRVLMTGLPTENVQKKDIIELFSSHVTPNVAVEPLFSENGFNGSCIFTISNAEEVLKTYDQFEGKYFDDMSTQIKVEYLIRPGGRIPAKIARQIIHDDQIIAMAPISSRPVPVQSSAYAPVAPPTGPANMQPQVATPVPAGNPRGVPRGAVHAKANGAPTNASTHVPSQPRNVQQQHQNGNPAKAHSNNNNNSANYHNNANSSTAGKSLLQRMGIGLAERISGAPVSGAASPAGLAGSGKGRKAGGAGPARPVSSISNQAKRNMKPYASFPPNASTHPKSQHANASKGKQQQQQPKHKDTQQEILDRELENFQKRRGK